MKLRLALWFAGLLALAVSSWAQTNVGLAPWFGNGMVLQRDSSTRLAGFGPPNDTLTMTFRHESVGWRSTSTSFPRIAVDKAGHWEQTFDFTRDAFRGADAGWMLVIKSKKHSKILKDYQDIHFGNVVLLAGWEKQGLHGDSKEFLRDAPSFELDKDKIRFLDLTQLSLVNGAAAGDAHWENWPVTELQLARYSTLQLRLAHLLAGSSITNFAASRYMGIVLVDKKILDSALAPERLRSDTGFKRLDEEIWNWISKDVGSASASRMQALIDNKRKNVVEQIRTIDAYDRARYGMWSDFATNLPPKSWFTFRGAIWSSKQ
jgi:hypothetical protein